ncbi:hypothetical protein [Actinokineospora enzanensis]|uniref:hypothetical protein n=1 Tax=Actinokineospora enzanensis TaxID=155975 RepID=UPI0003829946|nr:hypothetical protein [Actinokineospora enzanensis]
MVEVMGLGSEPVAFARDVVARYYPDELEIFDDIVADYADDPVGTVRGVRGGGCGWRHLSASASTSPR